VEFGQAIWAHSGTEDRVKGGVGAVDWGREDVSRSVLEDSLQAPVQASEADVKLVVENGGATGHFAEQFFPCFPGLTTSITNDFRGDILTVSSSALGDLLADMLHFAEVTKNCDTVLSGLHCAHHVVDSEFQS